ncbi:MAG: AAA family ATPase [Clostridiales bacterium]|nr:AAA family ATPase [Clostridiales bacterium]
MFGENGLYILDEPEAALSPMGIIRLMQRMNELVEMDCQFIISTHSPMLLCFPDAEVYQITKNGLDSVRFQDTDHYRTTVRFLQNPESAVADILGYETEKRVNNRNGFIDRYIDPCRENGRFFCCPGSEIYGILNIQHSRHY